MPPSQKQNTPNNSLKKADILEELTNENKSKKKVDLNDIISVK
jgi:hypothetical protein